MSWITDPSAWIGLLTLTVLEIVLNIDNIIFISILSGKLPLQEQAKARNVGLLLAFVIRVLLLFSITWIIRLTAPLFTVMGHGFSGRDLILLGGGLFLVAKATFEIHSKLEGEVVESTGKAVAGSLAAVIVQITIIDIVFSIDSVVTAIGMANSLPVMLIANAIALVVMVVSAAPVASFVDKHPTVKMLALSFLVLIGTNLIAEAMGQHIPKGYTYFAMAFSFGVEMLNLRLRSKAHPPVRLHDTPRPEEASV